MDDLVNLTKEGKLDVVREKVKALSRHDRKAFFRIIGELFRCFALIVRFCSVRFGFLFLHDEYCFIVLQGNALFYFEIRFWFLKMFYSLTLYLY